MKYSKILYVNDITFSVNDITFLKVITKNK